jgi:hypothetical protein
MDSLRRPIEGTDRQREAGYRRGRWGVLMFVALVLLSFHAAWGQGNPAMIVRQLQARIANLSEMVQRQNAQMAAERQERLRLQQQMAAQGQRLQRLQAAVNSAAAAGDPTAKAVRSSNAAAVLDKLAAQFEAAGRSAPAGGRTTGAEGSAVVDLSGARLTGAVLQGAKLASVNLKGADLRNADLTHSVLQGANLRGAKLQGTTLTGADLTNADLTGALYDDHTRWPDRFDPQKHGALQVK